MSFFSRMRTQKSHSAPQAQQRPVARRFRPKVEALEDRCLPSYGLATTYAVAAPYAIATADLNGDGRPDLITAGTQTVTHTVSAKKGSHSTVTTVPVLQVLLGNPNSNGAFAAAQTYPVQNGGWSVAVGDFNDDHKLDLVTGNGTGLSVLLGNGDGTFQQAKNYTFPNGTYLAACDVNGDGKLDLVTGVSYPEAVVVLLGNGDGTFQAGPTYTGSGAAVAVGDFNGDGKLDVIARTFLNSYTGWSVLNLLLGNGDGTFGAAQTIFGSYDGAYAVAIEGVTVGDFNGDGTPDLAVVDRYVGYQSTAEVYDLGYVLLGGSGGLGSGYAGGGGFLGLFDTSGHKIVGLAAADVNGDGKLDLIAMNANGWVDILSGNGDGTFMPGDHSYEESWQNGTFVVGDFNGDGFPDLAVLQGNSVQVRLWNSKTQW
jgi:hypothetical protein